MIFLIVIIPDRNTSNYIILSLKSKVPLDFDGSSTSKRCNLSSIAIMYS